MLITEVLIWHEIRLALRNGHIETEVILAWRMLRSVAIVKTLCYGSPAVEQ